MIWPDDFVNKIICGDCLEVMKKMPDQAVNLIQADPPFNFDVNLNKNGEYSKSSFLEKAGKNYIKRIKDAFGHDFQPEPFLETSTRVMKKYNAYWWTSKNLVHRYISWALDHKFSFNILTWHKLNPLPLWHGNYLPDTEYCIFIRQKGAYFNSRLDNWEKYRKFYTSYSGIINKGHPTVKPKYIIKTQIEISSGPGDIVLDPFLGSGTTADACRELGRKFIGIEINPGYCKIAEERLAQGVL